MEFAGIYSGMGAKVDLFYRKPYPLTYVNSNIRMKVMWVQLRELEISCLICSSFHFKGIKCLSRLILYHGRHGTSVRFSF